MLSPLFWMRYFPMDSAPENNLLSERYVQKLNYGHTLQGHDAIVL